MTYCIYRSVFHLKKATIKEKKKEKNIWNTGKQKHEDTSSNKKPSRIGFYKKMFNRDSINTYKVSD